MHLTFTNINYAFNYMVTAIHSGEIPTVRRPSRVGEVLMIPTPVTITYMDPRQRVLYNQARDCNPFFHLFESIWMLAGRDDVEPLLYYNSKIGEIASDNGKTFHGAYGYRWRHQFGYDQLRVIIEELRNNRDSRRCVLQMWDATCDNPTHAAQMAVDGTVKRHDLWTATHGGKDVPCNTQVYFHIVDGKLDMTVCNRSNDLVWGCFGANVVHFSYLLEYMANCIGVPMGRYHQFTNNLHVYTERWYPEKWLADKSHDLAAEPCDIPLVTNRERFDQECYLFVDDTAVCEEEYLAEVVAPMMEAFDYHKLRDYSLAQEAMNCVEDEQWAIAGRLWLYKREKMWREKNDTKSD